MAMEIIIKSLNLKIHPGLQFVGEENGKPCHKHLLDGEEVPGCTSVSNLFQDDGWKFAWPPKLMSEVIWAKAKDEYQKRIESQLIDFDGVMWTWEELAEVLKNGKNAWWRKRDKSADTGTLAHKQIERYLAGDQMAIIESLDQEVINACNEFLAWEKKYNPKWLASELQVGSLKYRFAGILDALAEVEGKITLVDFKTSSEIKDDYIIQLAGLCIALEEMGLTVDQRAILHLPKTGSHEYRIINSDLVKDKLAFLVGLEFYRHKNLFIARCKHDRGIGENKRRAVANDRRPGRKNTGVSRISQHRPAGTVPAQKVVNRNIGVGASSKVQPFEAKDGKENSRGAILGS